MNNNVDMNMTTKDRIIESALILFAEKGYDGVGVDLIAENAGLRGPSIYKHFKGQEEILIFSYQHFNRDSEYFDRKGIILL